MLKTFGVDTGDFEIEFYELARAYTFEITPEDFVLNHGEKYGLMVLPQFPPSWVQS
jgi:hypothetical protein